MFQQWENINGILFYVIVIVIDRPGAATLELMNICIHLVEVHHLLIPLLYHDDNTQNTDTDRLVSLDSTALLEREILRLGCFITEKRIDREGVSANLRRKERRLQGRISGLSHLEAAAAA